MSVVSITYKQDWMLDCIGSLFFYFVWICGGFLGSVIISINKMSATPYFYHILHRSQILSTY